MENIKSVNFKTEITFCIKLFLDGFFYAIICIYISLWGNYLHKKHLKKST